MSEIHLGYQLATGEPVSIPIHHTVITGMTRLSGKTTTIEALLSRMPADYSSLVFRTKRGEIAFDGTHRVQVYYRPSLNDAGELDWQYVSSLLEAAIREKMKLERSFIINALKGARTLRDFYENVKQGREAARRGFDESIYTNLQAYMEVILPQLEQNPFAEELTLGPGPNVMELGNLSEEVQALVISACLQEIHAHHHHTVVVIPEAWKFLPQSRGNPVKWAAQHLVREGGASNLWLWLDSQDVTNVTKDALKSVGVWIMGRQNEFNEVKRVIAQLPTREKPKPDEVMTLPVGHFWVATERICKEVYVQPAWVDGEMAVKVATGQSPLGEIRSEIDTDSTGLFGPVLQTEEVADLKERLTDLQQLLTDTEEERDKARTESAIWEDVAKTAQEQTQLLLSRVEMLEKRTAALYHLEEGLRLIIGSLSESIGLDQAISGIDINELSELVVKKLSERGNLFGSGHAYTVAPLEALKNQYEQETVDRLTADIDKFSARQVAALKWLLAVGKASTLTEICRNLGFPTGGASFSQFSQGMKVLVQEEWVSQDSHGFKSKLKDKVGKSLAVYNPGPEDIEQTFNHLVAKLAEGRVAGSVPAEAHSVGSSNHRR